MTEPNDINDIIPRRSIWDPNVLKEVCELIIDGKSIRAIGRMPGMPESTHIYRAMAKNMDIREAIMRAREAGAHAMADEILDIADMSDDTGVNKARMQISARQWHTAKMAPRVYGDFKMVDSNVSVTVTKTDTLNIEDMSYDELEALERALTKSGLVSDGSQAQQAPHEPPEEPDE